MPTILVRATKAVLHSVSEATYNVDDVIENPDLSAVTGYPSKYWIVAAAPSTSITLMDAPARAAVDAAELEAARNAAVAKIDQVESEIRALALVLLDEVNTLRAQHSLAARTTAQLRAAIRAKLGS